MGFYVFTRHEQNHYDIPSDSSGSPTKMMPKGQVKRMAVDIPGLLRH